MTEYSICNIIRSEYLIIKNVDILEQITIHYVCMYLWIYFYLVKFYNSLLFVHLEKANDKTVSYPGELCQCTYPSHAYYGWRYPIPQQCPQGICCFVAS